MNFIQTVLWTRSDSRFLHCSVYVLIKSNRVYCSMMSQIETQYDMFMSSLSETIKNVDVYLMLKIMYLERRLPDVAPHVELEIKLKSEVNPSKKQRDIRTKYGFQMSSLGEHGLFAVGQMSMSLVEELAKDSDIEKISGMATPASYS